MAKTKEESRAYQKAWHLANKEKRNAQERASYYKHREKRIAKFKAYQLNLRFEAFKAYGNKCSCCGESNKAFLCIDHVNGNGNTHRKNSGIHSGNSTYSWLKKNGYPDGFQTLCFNCNSAKSIYGICPHQWEGKL